MAFNESLAISSVTPTAGSGSNVTFVTTERGLRDTVRMNSASSLSDPELYVIRHQAQGSNKNGGIITDRHLVQTTRVERDTAGVAYTCVANITFAVPRVGLFSDAEVQRQLFLLTNFLLGNGNMTALLQNQS